MFGARRWCFTICALLTLCPRSLYVEAASATKLSRFTNNNIYKPTGGRLRVGLVQKPAESDSLKRSDMTLFRYKSTSNTALRLEESEPGFDLNANEITKLKIWPGGLIPYFIDSFSFDKIFSDRLRTFLEEVNAITGLNFLEIHQPPRDVTSRWVFFVNRQGLLSCIDHPLKNFTTEGVQKIVLGYDCLVDGGELADTVLSLVGVPPQHNAPNRDRYVDIIKENIIPEKAHLFEKLPDTEWLFHDVDYDFASAGHYPLHKYTVNGRATILPENDQGVAIGEGNGFSDTDIWKIRMLYNHLSKKKLKSANLLECKKIFNLGSNASASNVHDSEEDIKPRQKPNRYLGLPEDTTPSPADDEEVSKDTDNKDDNKLNNQDEETDTQDKSEVSNDSKPQVPEAKREVSDASKSELPEEEVSSQHDKSSEINTLRQRKNFQNNIAKPSKKTDSGNKLKKKGSRNTLHQKIPKHDSRLKKRRSY